MARSQEPTGQGPFTEALARLYGLAGEPTTKGLEAVTRVSATTIEGWLKEGRTPRNRTVALNVVKALLQRGGQRVPLEMRLDEFWLDRLREQKKRGASPSTQRKGGPAAAGSATGVTQSAVPADAVDAAVSDTDPAGRRPRWSRPRGIVVGIALVALVAGGAVGAYEMSRASAGDGWQSSADDSPSGRQSTAPLTFVADSPSWQCGDAVVVPGTIGASQMVPGPRPADGVSASKTGLGFTVQGKEGQTVTLLGLAVEVVSKHEPLRGSRVPVVCQGDPPNRNLSVNLDQARPQVVKAAARAGDGGSASDTGWPYTVSGSDPEHFVVQPSTHAHDVTFTLRLQWAWNGKRGELRIDDQGKPFRTTADRNATWLCPDSTSTRLVRLTDGKTCAS
ncbi:hypothetical protein [Streptomyces sp. NBC_01451]|uniref:hypothetical protein n=1 Tax=Streptomyces sp. NBC_01451 TaxID=2903872 RepID=UPI002E30DA54|nr:hypothetical protein [Streptomyces sp. NBC_01451]